MLRALISLFILMCSTAAAQENADNPLAPLDTSSPRATYSAFINSARQIERHYRDYRVDETNEGVLSIFEEQTRASRLFDLSRVPAAQRGEVGSFAVASLFDILVRLPALDPVDIPGDGELPDSWTIPNTEIRIVRIGDGPQAGAYLFSAETLTRLSEFHGRIIAYPPLQPTDYEDWTEQIRFFTGPIFSYDLISSLPDILTRPFFGTQIWKAVLSVVIWTAIAATIVGWALLIGRFNRERHTTVRALILRMTLPVLLAGLTRAAHWFAVYQSSLAGFFAEAEVILTTSVLYFALAWVVLLACRLVAELVVALPAIPDQSYDAHLLRLIARVSGLLAAGGVLIYGADKIGIPAFGIIAGVGVGGAALALAAQSTVENLFGGISIFVDRPFRIGNFIQYGSSSGVVEAIGPRSTRIRGLDGTLTTVPNADLAKIHIVNFSLRNKCFFTQVLGLRHETTRLQIEWILATMEKRLLSHSMVEASDGMPSARLITFGSSSIDIEIRAYVLTTDFEQFRIIRQELLLELQGIIEEGGSGFAFPSQTLYLGRDGGLDEEARERAESSALSARGKSELTEPT